jgi:hypothetical protein
MDSILRFIWRSILASLFLLFAPAIFIIFPLVVVHYTPQDDMVGLLKVLLGVLGPFSSAFWFVICCELPKFYTAMRDGRDIKCKRCGRLICGGCLGNMLKHRGLCKTCVRWSIRQDICTSGEANVKSG